MAHPAATAAVLRTSGHVPTHSIFARLPFAAILAPAVVDEDFDFEQAMTEIHEELAGLNAEAAELAETIQKNLEELGV